MAETKPNILYVDDEKHNLVSFVAAFRRYYNIFTAESGREALAILKKHPIQLIITDQRMPEMTGVQFLEAVIPDFPEPMRLILTGFSDIEAIVKAINTGRVYRYITKPWNEVELKVTIDLALKTYFLEQENKRLIARLSEEAAQQKKIMRFFKKYVPEPILNEILSDFKDAAITNGEHRIISVLFFDISNFSEIAAQLDPQQTVSLLNAYFSLMSDCINNHKGSLNKFLGGGLLALFGAPVSYIDNQYNAACCALEMRALIDGFNAQWEAVMGAKLAIGAGIHTGAVVIGNIGSSDHMEYTVMGDTVNVASGIKALTKNQSNAILIGETTYAPIKESFKVEKLPLQEIKGIEGKMQLYRLLSKSA